MVWFMEHRRDVPGGDLWTCTACGSCRGRSQRAVAREFGLSRETVRLRRHAETTGERFKRDHSATRPMPAAPYEACKKIAARVSSLLLVRYRSNDYSVPTEYGHSQVWGKGYRAVTCPKRSGPALAARGQFRTMVCTSTGTVVPAQIMSKQAYR